MEEVDKLQTTKLLPNGYRVSSLLELSTDPVHHLSRAVGPKLDPNGVRFAEMDRSHAVSKADGTLASIKTPINLLLSIVSVEMVPPPNMDEMKVLSRQIRVVLFDKNQFLGNVHTIELDPSLADGSGSGGGGASSAKSGGKGKGKKAGGGGGGGAADGKGGYQLSVGRKSMGMCKGSGPESLMSWDVAKVSATYGTHSVSFY